MAKLNGRGKREWDLSGRKLKSLSQTPLLSQGQEARRVDLQRNKLKQFSGLSTLLYLQELNLSRNELVEFPTEVGSLHHLERLYMNQNSIKSIPEGVFSQLGKLQFLKLSTNRLTKLPADLIECRDLAYLNVSKNCLKDLQALVGLSKLKELFVEKNNLTELPSQLFLEGGSKLSMFKATGNPLRCPPEEVCEGRVEDIRIYFRLMEESPATNTTTFTVKTMFLGSSMAGKSTLSRSLKHGRPVEVRVDDRTEGIEISQLHIQGVRFLFWDFAGQEEYYLTHHVFITPRALVILAVDLANYSIQDPQSYDEKVGFWVNNIQLRVPNSVVLLVGTHCDQCRDEEEIMEKKRDIESKVKHMQSEKKEALELKKKYLEDSDDSSVFSDQMEELTNLLDYNLLVLDLVTIDCTKEDEIIKLREHISKQTKEQTFPCAERTLPKSYEEVEKAIQGLTEHEQIPLHGIVCSSKLKEMLKLDHDGQTKENLNSILRYLHRIGIIVWYEDVKALCETVFLQPSILISLFKTIVRPDLEPKLKDIPKRLLLLEQQPGAVRQTWVADFNGRGTLHHVAMRILIRQELKRLGLEEEDLVSEVVGTKTEKGIVLNLLQHFEVCLPVQLGRPLDPQAPEFIPGERRWDSASIRQRDQDRAGLFPCYLKDSREVSKMWGEDKQDDLNVRVYLLPEIPHGFFHRLVIKTCSLYPSHWIGKDQCLLYSDRAQVLLRQRTVEEDQCIEIRCKRPEITAFRRSWSLILSVMSKLLELSSQWPGLAQQVHSPCPERGCPHYYVWQDWMVRIKSIDENIYERRGGAQPGCRVEAVLLALSFHTLWATPQFVAFVSPH
ncbi:malignant fibrous histiocytoma-amplified sequence 1 [Aplochiton taeniatus]